MNRPWEDLLYPRILPEHGDGQNTNKGNANWTELGGLSKGFRSDFWLRGYKMLGQMTGEISFIQCFILSVTGRLMSRDEDRLINTMFVNNALSDPRFWLFRTARLAATVKSPPSSCLSAGILVNDGSFLASGAAYHTSTFFYQTRNRLLSTPSLTLEQIIKERLEAGHIIGGFGRVLARGEDERNPSLLDVAQQCNLADGEYLKQAFAIEKLLQKFKNPNLYMNSAGLGNALFLDLGFTPQQIMMIASFMFVIGMSGNIVEAYERPPGEFSALTDDDIEYTGPARKKLPYRDDAPQQVVAEMNGARLVVMDSVSFLVPENRGDIVVCGSHGGQPAARYSLRYSPGAIVFSDGGKGKDDAGIEGLTTLDEAGIPAMAVSVASARIGDGMDTYRNGRISALNTIAGDRGVTEGMTVIQALQCLAEINKTS